MQFARDRLRMLSLRAEIIHRTCTSEQVALRQHFLYFQGES